MGIDLYEVIRAAATKPFGFVLIFRVQVWEVTISQLIPFISHGKLVSIMHTRFIELAGEINSAMPNCV